MGEEVESRAYNGMPAGELKGACWWKSGRSSAQGNCIETAATPAQRAGLTEQCTVWRSPANPASSAIRELLTGTARPRVIGNIRDPTQKRGRSP